MSLPTADRVREPKGAPRRWPSLFVRLVAPLGTASVAAGAVWLHFASLDVVTGTSVADALKTYTGTLGGIVGSGNITSN